MRPRWAIGLLASAVVAVGCSSSAPPVPSGTCGNGIVEGAEQCDDGNAVAGDGCEPDCRFTCSNAGDCPAAGCNGPGTCDPSTHLCSPGPVVADGTPCPDGDFCNGDETCVSGLCTPGTVINCADTNPCSIDSCDPPVGCTHQPAPATTVCRAVAGDCDVEEACDGVTTTCPADAWLDASTTCRATTGVCDVAETCGTGPACPADAFVADGTLCDADGNPATRDLCVRGACGLSVCGDGYVDATAGETCEPPAPNCSPTTCQAVPCGDGILDPGQQCDDGNTVALDGCDPLCRLEQVVRLTDLSVLPPAEGCTNLDADPAPDNNLGGALSPQERSAFDDFINTLISNGDLIALGLFMDLDDVLGQNDPMVRMALLMGTDASPPFDQTRGEQFWIDPSSVDASRTPLGIVSPGSIVAGALASGPGRVVFPLPLQRAQLSGTVVPDTAVPRIDSLTGAMLCGGWMAADLDRFPVTPEVVNACPRYMGDSLLDVLVGGCMFGGVTVLTATQPDVDVEGDGIYSPALEDTNGDGRVDLCRDGSAGVVITGDDCAQDPRFDDAFSVAFSLNAIRVQIVGVGP